MLNKLNPLNWLSDTRFSGSGWYRTDDDDQLDNPIPASNFELRLKLVGTHTLPKPIYGFKATKNCVLRVIIPRGEEIVVPSDTHVPFSAKYRTSKLYVDKIVPVKELMGDSADEPAESIRRGTYKYHEGQMHTPRNGFDRDPSRACAAGLHFFIEPELAVRFCVSHGSATSSAYEYEDEIIEKLTMEIDSM